MLQTSTKQISLTLKQLQTLIPSPVSVFFLSLQLYKAKKKQIVMLPRNSKSVSILCPEHVGKI